MADAVVAVVAAVAAVVAAAVVAAVVVVVVVEVNDKFLLVLLKKFLILPQFSQLSLSSQFP